MIGEAQYQFFEAVLFESLGKQLEVTDMVFKSGGCINNAVKLTTGEGAYFLKWNEHVESGMFEAEARGLELIRKSGLKNVPVPINFGKVENKFYLLLGYLEEGVKSEAYWEELGRSLAGMHACQGKDYGLDFNNFIGRLPQNNEFTPKWSDFFIEKRLQVQLGLAIYNKLIDSEFVKSYKSLYKILPDILPEEKPVLVHGDLWSGNVMTGPDGKGWFIDPAVYFGHREVDLAFTRLFGGFEEGFYNAYNEVLPLEPGFAERAEIYNIYPLMVHVNLFGLSYLSGVQRILKKYVD